jgi:hypothetical protein
VFLQATLGQGAAATASAAPAPAPAAIANGTVPAAGSPAGELAAYDKLLAEQLQPFMSNAAAVGGEVSMLCESQPVLFIYVPVV